MLHFLRRTIAATPPITPAERARIDIENALAGNGSLYNLSWGRTDISFGDTWIVVRKLFINHTLIHQGAGRAVIQTLQKYAREHGMKIMLLTVEPTLADACKRHGFNKISDQFDDWIWSPG